MTNVEKEAIKRAKCFLNTIISGCISEKAEARKALAELDTVVGNEVEGEPFAVVEEPKVTPKAAMPKVPKEPKAPKVPAVKKEGGKK